MIPVSDNIKQLLMLDKVEKQLTVSFTYKGATAPFLILGNDQIVSESLRIDESLCSGEELSFGSCESSSAELTVTNVEEDIKGSIMRVMLSIEDNDVPLGVYIVDSAKRQPNLIYKDVVAYDYMTLFDIDVTEWYKSLVFPTTVKTMRQSLCQHIGVLEIVPDYLPNDALQVDRTIEPTSLFGRSVLKAIEEINGVFGHFDRNGILRHIALEPGYGLYPAIDLYPSLNLFPVAENDGSYANLNSHAEQLGPSLYAPQKVIFEEYTVKEFDKLQICQEDGDIGAIVGDGSNAYTIKGNFLVFGKNAAELKNIAESVSGLIYKRPYRPYTAEIRGLPYIEVGDTITFDDQIVSYVLARSLSGIVAMQDSFSAFGPETRRETTTVNDQIIQLQGKATIITKNVDGLSVKVIDLEKNTDAQFKVVADEVSTEVKRAQEAEGRISLKADGLVTQIKNLENNTNSKIEQTASGILSEVNNLSKNTNTRFEQTAKSIEAKVNIDGVISAINLEKGTAKISAEKISLDGITEFSTMDNTAQRRITIKNGQIYLYRSDTNTEVGYITPGQIGTSRGIALNCDYEGSFISFGKKTADNSYMAYYTINFGASSISSYRHGFSGSMQVIGNLAVSGTITTTKGDNILCGGKVSASGFVKDGYDLWLMIQDHEMRLKNGGL